VEGPTPEPTRHPSPEAPTPEPTRRLPAEARGYFLLGALAGAIPLAIGCLVGAGAVASSDAPGVLAWLLRVLAVLVVALGGVVLPLLRWRSWRYEVRDEEIDLLRGVLVVRRTLIPMTRVQHVDTQRTVLSDLFGLRSVTVHTAAGSHTIPALRPGDATAIRDRIALLAREPDEL
jgi:membrane protein YdbS with pleckstrin-like domain